MNSAANIFLGVTEAPLLVKPYLGSMTRSELFAVLCGGLASIAGTMLVSYASLGVKWNTCWPLPLWRHRVGYCLLN